MNLEWLFIIYRPEGVPLIFETFSWTHGIFTGACLKSEATAAAEFKAKVVMHDPMAMRPFMGYNFGKYLQHWISLNKDNRKVNLHCVSTNVSNDLRVILFNFYLYIF